MLEKYFDIEKVEELKNSNNELYKALELSINLFKNDIDKGGFPSILHIMYVYRHVQSYEEKIIALLHDILESKKLKKEDLLDLGFSKKIVDDIVILTRVKPKDYMDYIDDIIKNGSKEALNVKIADLKHNMDMSRIKNPTIKDYERVEKRYSRALEKIYNKLEEK